MFSWLSYLEKNIVPGERRRLKIYDNTKNFYERKNLLHLIVSDYYFFFFEILQHALRNYIL